MLPLRPLTLVLLVSALAPVVSAETYTFLGGQSGGSWSDPANWQDGVKPPSPDGDIFDTINIGTTSTSGPLPSILDLGPNGFRLSGLNLLAPGGVALSGRPIGAYTVNTLNAGAGNHSIANDIDLGNTSTVTVAGTLALDGRTQSLNLYKEGSGTLVFNQPTSFSDTYINAGTIVLAADSGFYTEGEMTLEGTSVLRLADITQTMSTLNGTSSATTVDLGNGQLSLINGRGDFAGRITGAGSLFVSSLQNFSNPNNDYTGNTIVDGFSAVSFSAPMTLSGGLVVSNFGAMGYNSSGELTFGGTSTLNGGVGVGEASGSIVFKGDVTDTSNFYGYGGPGTIRFEKSYTPGGAAAASINFGGGLTLGSSDVLYLGLGGTTSGTGYDHLSISKLLTLGGTLEVSSFNGFSPMLGNSFDLFDWGTRSGTFSSINLPALGSGLMWNTSALYTTGTIRVTQAVPEPASMVALGLGVAAILRRRRK